VELFLPREGVFEFSFGQVLRLFDLIVQFLDLTPDVPVHIILLDVVLMHLALDFGHRDAILELLVQLPSALAEGGLKSLVGLSGGMVDHKEGVVDKLFLAVDEGLELLDVSPVLLSIDFVLSLLLLERLGFFLLNGRFALPATVLEGPLELLLLLEALLLELILDALALLLVGVEDLFEIPGIARVTQPVLEAAQLVDLELL
jgi:hypothetical protein